MGLPRRLAVRLGAQALLVSFCCFVYLCVYLVFMYLSLRLFLILSLIDPLSVYSERRQSFSECTQHCCCLITADLNSLKMMKLWKNKTLWVTLTCLKVQIKKTNG